MGERSMIEVTDIIEPWRLTEDAKQVTMEDRPTGKVLFLAGYDYYEMGNVPFSGVWLNLAELEHLVALLRA